MILPYGGRQEAATCTHSHSGVAAMALRGLCVSYAGGIHAVCGVSFAVKTGERLALTGHNGCGKSTVLKAIAGLVPRTEGELLVGGHSPSSCRHRIAYLAQRSSVDWTFPMTLMDLLLSGRFVHLGWLKRPSVEDRARVVEIAAKLRLAPFLQRQIGQLSGGQQQRALIGRALIQEADLLLLDEPFNALDPESRQEMLQLFDGLSAEGRTLITATHHLDDLENHFDRQVHMNMGRIEKEVDLRQPAGP
ncbi:MAG: hypothetical protein RL095_940 [Verrucomicrobiota bacterium]|jgi:manganese/zinc/iron transport system ATP- binding protein